MKRWRFIRLGVSHGGWLPSRAKPAPKYNPEAMYANGWGVLKDSLLAHMWLNIAGANGHEDQPRD